MNAVHTAAAAGPSAGRRRYDFDALRGFAMLLGIGLHASLAYFPAPWWVQDPSSGFDGLFDEFLWAVHGFRMPVFFLMSGFFTSLLWRRRGLGALLKHRLQRVGLPLLIGLATIVPLTSLVGEWAAGTAPSPEVSDTDIFARVYTGDVEGVAGLLERGVDVNRRSDPGGWTLLHAAAFTGNTEMLELLISRGAEPAPVAGASQGETPLGVAFYFGHEEAADLLVAYEGGDPLPDGTEWSDIPGWGEGARASGLNLSDAIQRFFHLWFLWFLLWLVAGFAIVAWMMDRRDTGRMRNHSWPRWIMWSLIPVTMVPQLFMGGGGAYPAFGPDTSDGFIPLFHVLAYYAMFFTFGALLYRREGRGGELLVDTLGRPWWLYLSLSLLVVFPAGLIFTFEPRLFFWPVASVLQVAYAWGMCFGLIGMFRMLVPEERREIRYLSDSSYWMYLAHLPVVVVAQVIVRDWQVPAEVKFVMVCAIVTAFLLVCYRLFVRYTPIGTLLNGKKVRPAGP